MPVKRVRAGAELVPWSNCEAENTGTELVPWSNWAAGGAGTDGAVVDAGRAIAITATSAMATRTAPRARPRLRRSGAVETVRGAADIRDLPWRRSGSVWGPVDRRLRDVPHARLVAGPCHRAAGYRRRGALPQSARPCGPGALPLRHGRHGVEGRRVGDGLRCGVRIRAGFNVRGAPRLAAPRVEVACLLRD